MSNILKLSFIYYVMLSCSAQDPCVKKSPCMCVFSNGTGIDLSDAASKTFYSSSSFNKSTDGHQYHLQTYYFNPCTDLKFDIGTKNATKNTCIVPLSICQKSNTFTIVPNTSTFSMDGESYTFAGSTTNVSFIYNVNGISLVYKNEVLNSATTVRLVCSQNVNELHITDISNAPNTTLTFYSSSACPRQIEEVGRSFGSTLLIIMFSCVIFYLVLGVLTRKFLMGATGLEVIPNLNFWLDLPNLVKDGWAFAINGFKLPNRHTAATTSPDPNSYDSI